MLDTNHEVYQNNLDCFTALFKEYKNYFGELMHVTSPANFSLIKSSGSILPFNDSFSSNLCINRRCDDGRHLTMSRHLNSIAILDLYYPSFYEIIFTADRWPSTFELQKPYPVIMIFDKSKIADKLTFYKELQGTEKFKCIPFVESFYPANIPLDRVKEIHYGINNKKKDGERRRRKKMG